MKCKISTWTYARSRMIAMKTTSEWILMCKQRNIVSRVVINFSILKTICFKPSTMSNCAGAIAFLFESVRMWFLPKSKIRSTSNQYLCPHIEILFHVLVICISVLKTICFRLGTMSSCDRIPKYVCGHDWRGYYNKLIC